MKTLLELAKKRKSIRVFSDKEINLDDVIYAIEVAKEAPSGANMQPWRFIIVTSAEIKKKIKEKCEEIEFEYHKTAPLELKEWFMKRGIDWHKSFLEGAPVLILVFSDKTAPYHIQSTWIAVGYMLLALEERNLVSLTYTPSKVKWANTMFNIPQKYLLQVVIPVGKQGDTSYKKQPRHDLKNVLLKII